ncbi:MAG: cation diffusion facilitator family transporter [gamma proteobacterium symbiont of Bathyaustriella thionipta]|nr:cation diffusion facilitator family transporter [gamma proteobacterium symbiont of Bathyaustriella thionipta]
MSAHSHQHNVPESGRRLAVVIILNFIITITEIIGGVISGSLSLLSDALHNFSDGIAVIIAWIAIRLDARPRSELHTFGLKRAQVLAAVINAGALVAISVYLFIEASHRFNDPHPISGVLMSAVATIGLVANILGTWLLHRGSKQNMNLKAAYLHLLSDAISSVGVILGGLAIAFWNVHWIDPVLTILIGLYVLKESLHILWRSLGIFMLATPQGLSLTEVREAVLSVLDVKGTHHIHLWEVAEQDIHFEAHIEVADQPLHDTETIRHAIEKILHDQFEITHVTLQIEPIGGKCSTADLF